MEAQEKKVQYPENLYLKLEVFKSGKKIEDLAKLVGVSRKLISETINGKYKGQNIKPKLRELLGLPPEEQTAPSN